jgi:hydrogenase maturation factor HypF (carbamoyltransferase family)
MLKGMVHDLEQGIRPETILCKVCDTFGRWMLNLATSMHPRLIVLSGVAFENGLFTDWMAGQLRSHGFQVLLPGELPLHDGGLAAGQILAHARGMDVEPSVVPSLKHSLSRLTQPSSTKPFNDLFKPT